MTPPLTAADETLACAAAATNEPATFRTDASVFGSEATADTCVVESAARRAENWIKVYEDNKRVMSDFATSGIVTGADYYEAVCDARPDQEFILDVSGGPIYTYAQIDALANGIARAAASRGLRQGDVVALAMENCPRFIMMWLGLAKIGVTIACINTNVTGPPLVHAIKVAAATHAIVSQEQKESHWMSSEEALSDHVIIWEVAGCSFDANKPLTEFDIEACKASGAERPCPTLRNGVRGGDALFLIYTSGTTGQSKAAVFSHTRFIGAGVTWTRAMSLTATDRFYVTLPLYHGNGGCVAVSAVLRSGSCLVLRKKFSVSNFLPDIRTHGCTATIYIGEMWRYLYNTPGKDDDHVNPLRVACGNGLRGDIWRAVCDRFGVSLIVEHYGQTEMPSAHPMINNYNVVGSCGYVPPSVRGTHGTECLIAFDIESNAPVRDANGWCIRCGPGEDGESIVMLQDEYKGYTSGEDATRAVYRDVFEKGDRWYHSGDLLRHDADGFFYFVDRIGDTFRWKGENVATGEVCEAVGKFAAVQEANVYGVSIPGTEGRAGMASIVPQSNLRFDMKAMYDHVTASLPTYARPLFLRMRMGEQENAKTSTFKFQKVAYQRQGIDLDAVAPDSVFFLDPSAQTYVELTREMHGNLVQGNIRV